MRTTVVWWLAALVVLGAATKVVAGDEAGGNSDHRIRSRVTGPLVLPTGVRDQVVDVETDGDAGAAESLRARMRALGYHVADAGESGEWHLALSIIYSGTASGRPLFKNASDSGGEIHLGRLMPTLWSSIAYALRPEAGVKTLIVDVAGRAAGLEEAVDGPPKPIARPSSLQVLVTRVEAATGDGSQATEVATYWRGKDVTMEDVVADNIAKVVSILKSESRP